MEEMENKAQIVKYPKEFMDMLLQQGAIMSREGEFQYLFLPMVFEIVDKEQSLFKVHYNGDELPVRLQEFYLDASAVNPKNRLDEIQLFMENLLYNKKR